MPAVNELLSSMGSSFGSAAFQWFFIIFQWIVYGFGLALIVGAAWVFINYRYSVTIFQRRNSGNPNDFYIGKVISFERARVLKKENKWRLLFRGHKLPPIDDKYIMAGNRVYLFCVDDDKYIPTSFQCGNPEASFVGIPSDLRFWQQTEMQQAAQEYQKKTWLEQMQPYITAIVTVLICMGAVVFTVWFTMKTFNQHTIPQLVQGAQEAARQSAASSVVENIAQSIAPA